MKRLKITKLAHPEKSSVFTKDLCYKVNLGNGICKHFKAKADAIKFLNEVSKYLTYKMHECNELYVACFTYYRRAWFYFDHDKLAQGNFADLYRMERHCEDHIQTVNNAFNLLYRRQSFENGNYFIFTHFYNILNALQGITAILIELYESKSVAAINYELEILNKKIGYCRRTIENYSIELENSFTDVERIELKVIKTA